MAHYDYAEALSAGLMMMSVLFRRLLKAARPTNMPSTMYLSPVNVSSANLSSTAGWAVTVI